MPRQDGTGPDGSGRFGRGLGPCRKNSASDSAATSRPRGGQGAGLGGRSRRGNRKNVQE
ncbi:MAG: DUF5320 family protein [Deltaproteobacteria bacterium]|nr:DUF5320 family protein [Deltaproteobacteria bacterium]